MASKIAVSVGYPPDEDSKIAELIASVGRGVEAPAVVYQAKRGELTLRIFAPTGEVAYEYPVVDFQEALTKAIALLEES